MLVIVYMVLFKWQAHPQVMASQSVLMDLHLPNLSLR
jgi:hypothetical protein